MVNCLQTFVVYHFVAMAILMEQEKSFQKIENASHQLIICFGKTPIDVINRVETGAQLKSKTKVTRNYIKRYIRYVNVFSKNFFTSDDFSDDSLTSDDESLTNNVSNTEQNLYSDDETEKTTGENLIIDEDTHTTQTNSMSDTQNSNNKNETNNKSLPFTM